jgi:hypothetical protein
VVTAIGGRRCPALSIAPAASLRRSVPWSGIFCLGFPELGAQLVEVMCGDHLHERAVACDGNPSRAGVQVLDLPPVAVLVEQSGQLARAGGSGSVLVLAHVMAPSCRDLIRPAPGTGHGLHGARRVTAHCADLSHARGVDQPRCASAA